MSELGRWSLGVFFSVYLGDVEGFRGWRLASSRHARQLGLSVRIETRVLADGSRLGLGWLANGLRAEWPRFVETAGEIAAMSYGNETDESRNVIAVRVSLLQREVSFRLPLASPQRLYYARVRSGWVFSDDLRLVTSLTNARLDAHAVYLLFQYGAVPPGVALFSEVRRAPNGHMLVAGLADNSVRCTQLTDPSGPQPFAGTPEDAERVLTDQLDKILDPLPRGAVLYFSGGVDSGLLAARIAQLGRQDVQLVSFAFDGDDMEYQIAARMASHLRLRCERVSCDPGQAVGVLERARQDYSFPFGDISTIPTNLLVQASLSQAASAATVVEGTGADGSFGLGALFRKWRLVYAAPQSVRRLIAGLYDLLSLWRTDSRIERLSRFVRKSAVLPLTHAVLAQNALHGIAYDAPRDALGELSLIGTRYLDDLGRNLPPQDRLTLFDLLWVCAGRMAPKTFDPLRTRGIRPIYPFLEPSVLALSSRLSWDVKCPLGVPKGLLKRALSRHVPAGWVYRRKIGFTRRSLARAVFQSAPVQEFLHDVVLSPHNPLRVFFRRDVVQQMIKRARHDSLSVGAYTFLWTVAFASSWLRVKSDPAMDIDDPMVPVTAVPSISC
jgi:asparagine synthetase B (glutamine-hydrolysing)